MQYEYIEHKSLKVFDSLLVQIPKNDIEYGNKLYTTEKQKGLNGFPVKEADDDNNYIVDGDIKTPKKTDNNSLTKNPAEIIQRADIDGAWKHALEILFFEFLQLFVPDIYNLIDHNTEPESKETELNELLFNSKKIKRIVDKLVKVKFKNGIDAYLLIHIEAQSKVKTYKQQLDFAARMHEYHKMLSDKFDKHQHINIGVLLNSTGAAVYNSNKNKPSIYKSQLNQVTTAANQLETTKYSYKPTYYLESAKHQNLDYLIYKIKNVLQQETTFKFPVVHLAKWLEHQDQLKALAHSNTFAIIVLYQLVALKHPTKKARNNAKIELINLTRKYNYNNEILRELIYLIDMMIVLPENQNIEFYNEVKTMGTEVQERFVSIFERVGIRKGLEQGLEKGLVEGEANAMLRLLSHKFGHVSQEVTKRIKSANIQQLEKWSLNLFEAQTIDDVFKN